MFVGDCVHTVLRTRIPIECIHLIYFKLPTLGPQSDVGCRSLLQLQALRVKIGAKLAEPLSKESSQRESAMMPNRNGRANFAVEERRARLVAQVQLHLIIHESNYGVIGT
jgi:hypothetical protein